MRFNKRIIPFLTLPILACLSGCGPGRYSLNTMIDQTFDTLEGKVGAQKKLLTDAESGNSKSQERLGDYYFNGFNNKNDLLNSSGHGYKNSYYLQQDLIEIPKDRAQAIEWYKKASLQGSGAARAKLLFTYAIESLNQQPKDNKNPFQAYINAIEYLSADLKSSMNMKQEQNGIQLIAELKRINDPTTEREVMAKVCTSQKRIPVGSSIEIFRDYTLEHYHRIEKQIFSDKIRPYTFANEELQAVLWGMTGDSPSKNVIYGVGDGFVSVQQVMDGGVLVAVDLSIYGNSAYQYPMPKYMGFVRTNEPYVDGNNLKKGLYVCTGTMTYKTVLGANKTVYTFTPINRKMLNLENEKFYFYRLPF